jgi:hypothetical protein
VILELRTDRRQRADDWHCGAVVAATLLDLCGFSQAEATDRVRRGLPISPDGVHPATLESFLRAQGCLIQVGTMSVADLKHHADQDRAVACLIRDHGGHWVVSLGVAYRQVQFHDPSDGRRALFTPKWEAGWYDLDRYGCEFKNYGIAVWRE